MLAWHKGQAYGVMAQRGRHQPWQVEYFSKWFSFQSVDIAWDNWMI